LCLEIAFIRTLFGIEREFDRYYDMLKAQLRAGMEIDDVRDYDELGLATDLTFDHSKVWWNPSLDIPLEKAHL